MINNWKRLMTMALPPSRVAISLVIPDWMTDSLSDWVGPSFAIVVMRYIWDVFIIYVKIINERRRRLGSICFAYCPFNYCAFFFFFFFFRALRAQPHVPSVSHLTWASIHLSFYDVISHLIWKTRHIIYVRFANVSIPLCKSKITLHNYLSRSSLVSAFVIRNPLRTTHAVHVPPPFVCKKKLHRHFCSA